MKITNISKNDKKVLQNDKYCDILRIGSDETGGMRYVERLQIALFEQNLRILFHGAAGGEYDLRTVACEFADGGIRAREFGRENAVSGYNIRRMRSSRGIADMYVYPSAANRRGERVRQGKHVMPALYVVVLFCRSRYMHSFGVLLYPMDCNRHCRRFHGAYCKSR